MSAAPHFDLAETPIEDGMTLIEASAGTGKTYCLTGLVVRLLVERKVESIGRILVVTFTNAAADELQSRIREAVRHAREVLAQPAATGSGERPAEPYLEALRQQYGPAAAEPLREALLAFDDLKVATIHGFCKQVLESHAFESGLPFDPELIEDDQALLLSAAEDLWRRRLYPAGREAAQLAALAAAQGWSPATFLGDYREMHRHPETRLLPPALSLEVALGEMERCRHEIAPLFDKAPLRLALSRLRFRDPGAFSRGRLDALAAEAAAFFAGELAALPALGALRLSALRKEVDPGSRGALEHLDFAAAADQLHQCIEAVQHALRAAVLADLDRRLAEIKERDAVFAFDDLLRRLRATLADARLGGRLSEAVRRRFGVALIDEFQDTDLVQYDIFRRLFGSLPLFLIGDPKQAIYRFRGADVFAYLAAKSEARRAYTLAFNWRSEGGLVRAVGQLFAGRRFPFVFQQIDFPRVEAAAATRGRRLEGDAGIPFVWHWLDAEESGEKAQQAVLDWLGRTVAAQLAANLELVHGAERRPLGAGDLAVLVRTNGEAAAVQEALRAVGVPAVVARAGDIFHSEEIAELELLVDAIVDSGHRGKLLAASATLIFGDDAPGLIELAADDRRWQARVAIFDELRERWRRAGFMAAMQDLLQQRQVRQRLLVLRDGERRLTNWQHAVEMVHQTIHERQLQPTAVAAWLGAERARASHARDSSELRLESDARAVKIVTVHKSKGLEYEVVFCPFLWRTQRADRLPVLAHVEGGRSVVYDFGSGDAGRHQLLAEAERLSEDTRLLYVALTRARRRCHVVWGRLGNRRRAAATALAYLLHAAQTPLELGQDAVLQASAGVAGLFDEIEGRSDLWLADLESLVRRAPGEMAIEKAAERAAAPPPVWPASDGALAAMPLPPSLARGLEPWRITSFSSLSRGVAGALPEIAEHQDPSWPSPRAAQRPSGLFAFARGTRAGSALHEIIEEADLKAPRSPAAEALVRRVLWRHGIAEALHHEGGESYDAAAAVLQMLESLAAAGLPTVPASPNHFRLGEVDRDRMLIEWEFHLPLDPLSTLSLSRLFERFAGELPRGYAGRVASLGERPVRGYLKGFVDLIFGHGERFYLIDWKSNHLGNSAADYPPAALELAMVEHHYVLQYLLYTVALHRHLGASLAGYDYERHFGGCFYLFLRGLAPGIPPSLFEPAPLQSGLYAARPSRELVEALDAAITRESEP